MIKIMTAINNPLLNEELKKENDVEIICKDIQYREGILEILEKNININYIIIDEKLPGEIDLIELIEKIIKKYEKIKIIITIKKENKNKINLNNKKIIKIFYEGKINLNKIKNYNQEKNKNSKKINKDLEKENKESKIITFLGERKSGKTVIIKQVAGYLSSKNYKILLVELNEESPSFSVIFKKEKSIKKYRKNKKILKINYRNIHKKYKKKYIDKKVLENMITKINKNIDLISYNKLINFNLLKKIKNKYNYLLIEIYSRNNKIKNKKIINNSYKNILIINPNLIEIKNNKKIIEKNNLNKINNFKIIINNYNKYSIDEKIIKNILGYKKIIGKIKYNSEFEKLINKKNINLNSKNKNDIRCIIDKVM